MSGGAIAEVVLSILFLFGVMSAIVSLAQSLLFQAIGWRSHKLRGAIERMLFDSSLGKTIAQRVYLHPLITGDEGSRKHIVWIDSSSFAGAVASAIQPVSSNADPVADLPHSIDELDDGELKRRMQMILPAASISNRRDEIERSIVAWYETSFRKTCESYKADAKAASYVFAAVFTVALNVSPVEVIQRKMQNEALRLSFASAVPSLTPLLFNPGEGLHIAPPASATAVPLPAQSAAGAVEEDDLMRMLALYQCAESMLSIPVGWEWMTAGASDSQLRRDKRTTRVSENRSCKAIVLDVRAGGNEKAIKSLERLGYDENTSFQHEFGPDFETDNPLIILAGWLLTVLAAAQGAPFWLGLVQRIRGTAA